MKNKIKKSAFTLIELMIVVWITWAMAMFWLSTLTHNKSKTDYDKSSNQILIFFKEARIYWMSNYIQTWSWNTENWVYKIPKWWYWFQIERWAWVNLWTWVVALKVFYNNDEDVKFSSWTDILIKEFKSWLNSIYFEKIYWTWTSLAYPSANSTWAVSDTNTWTVVFRNMIWDFPDDWSAFISSWTWSNNLRNLKIEFYMLEKWKKMYKRRIIFDRLNKSIISQSCKIWTWSNLEDCWESWSWKKWILWF